MEEGELSDLHDAPVNSMMEADQIPKGNADGNGATQTPPAPARSSSFGVRRGASMKRLDNGDVVEVVEVGRFAKFVAARPVVTMVLILVFIVLYCVLLGIPGYFAFFDGGFARRSLESRTSDSFLKIQEMCLDQTDGPGEVWTRRMEQTDGPALGTLTVVEEPFTVEQVRESLQFFFQSKSGNMLSQENLDSYAKLLDATVDVLGSFCLQSSGNCVPHHSITNAMASSAAELTSQLKVAPSNAQYMKTAKMFVGSDIDFEAGTTSWLKARVKVGGPLPSYDNLTHNEDEQLAKYSEEYKGPGSFGAPTRDGWIVKIQDLISEAEKENGDLRIYFVGGDNLLPRMFQGLFFDVGLAMFAIALVGAFMWLQVGSAFLCVCGMFQILASFVVTLCTWKLFGNGSFTFMHGLVIYIILGVGADDIFVFADAWKQSRHQASSISGSVSTRLQWSLSRAAKAMLVTSITTCSAFLLTAMTDLPIIATFGSFASLVIIWNFLLVITWFPACVVAHELYFVQWRRGLVAGRLCGCCCVACAEQWGLDRAAVPGCCSSASNAAVAPTPAEAPAESSAPAEVAVVRVEPEKEAGDGGGAGAGEEGARDLRSVERFFHSTLFAFLEQPRHRGAVLAVFAVLFVAGLVCAATGVRLTDRAVTETYLVDGHPLQVTLNLLVGTEDAFKPQEDSRKRAGYFVFGVDPADPIDRSGTDPLSEGEDLEKVGEPNLVEVDLGAPAAQEALVLACEQLKRLPSVLVAEGGGGRRPEVHCFMSDFRSYRLARGRPFPVPAAELVDELWAWRRDVTCAGEFCYKNADQTGVAQGRASDDWYDEHTNFWVDSDLHQLRAAFISANLSIPRMEQELSIIRPEYEEWRDAARDAGLRVEEQGELEVMGLTGRLEWIAIMDALVKGVKSGVPSSLVIALAVLVVSTANWVVALVATLTILGVMSTFFITFVASGWVLGMYECMFLQLTAGMAVDYTVHLAHAYNESAGATRSIKMREALTEMGVSVLSGAVSTLSASVCLFVCSFKVFYLYGSFIFFVILWAILWALFFFPAIMLTIGPAGDAGDIKIFRTIRDYLSGGPPKVDHDTNWTSSHAAQAGGEPQQEAKDQPPRPETATQPNDGVLQS